jgi:hypothetical protein
MLIKSLASLLLFASLHAGAQASVISITVYGTIATQAIDKSAMFGPIGADLNGLDFKATVSYDRPARTDFSNRDVDTYDAQINGAVPVDFGITINNRTLTRQFVPIQMSHTVGDGANSFADWTMFGTYTGNVENGVAFAFHILNYQKTFIPPRPRLESSISYDVIDADLELASVWLRPGRRSFGNLEFNAIVRRLEVSSDAVPVPEPAGAMLMLAAMATAGLALRGKA